MLRAIIISPDRDLSQQLETALSEVGHVGVTRNIDHYPSVEDFDRVIRAQAPQLLFLSTEVMETATALITHTLDAAPGIQIVGLSRQADSEILIMAMRAGVREFVSLPIQMGSLRESLTRMGDLLASKPVEVDFSDEVYSFLPSKAGVGASTIALNLARALSELPDTRVVLSDFDLNSGMMRFMLRLENTHSVADAAEKSMQMDENLWPKLVTSMDRLDVLHAGKLNPNMRIETAQIRHLIDFMQRNYKVCCFDLSGSLERFSLEIMQRSKKIFLVCTPEIPALHLAREKYNFLKSIGLADRVCILVNRCQKRMMITPANIQQLIGVPVFMTLPNDYIGVHRALQAAKWVDASSDLGKRFAELARTLLLDKSAHVGEQKKRFIEYFSVVPKGYNFPEGKKPAV